jgi:hypothetical protein
MRILKWSVVVVASGLALNMIASASAAAALPEFLGSLPNKFIGTTGEDRLETTSAVLLVCKDATIAGEITAGKTGTFDMDPKECRTPLGGNCHTVGDASGVILLSGKVELAYIKKTTKDVGIVFVINQVDIVCTGMGSFELLTRGGIVTLITPINTKTKHFTLNIKQAKGKQEYTEYENEAGEIKRTFLEESLGGAFTQEGLEAAESKLESEKELEIMG